MGLNFGAFAGGLAQGGLNAYKTISDVQSQAKRDELIELQAKEARQAMEEKAALKEAAGVYEQVGGSNYAPELQRTAGIGPQQAQGLAVNTGAGGNDFDQAVNQSTQGVLRENAQRQGAALPTDMAMKPAAYTREQADADYLSRVRAINPERALDTENKQTAIATGKAGLKAAERTERYAANTEAALGFQQNVLKDLAANKGDFGAVIEKHFIPLYNENKLPGLNDGGTAKVVDNAMGGGKSIVITDKGGKQTTLPANLETLQMLTGKAQDLMMASSSPENYWKHKESFHKEQELANQTRTADAHVKTAEAAMMNAKTSREAEGAKSEYYRALAKRAGMSVTDNKLEEIDANSAIMMRADPKLTKEQADVKAAQLVFKSPEMRADVITPEHINTFIQNNPDLMQKKDAKSGKMVPLTGPERADVARAALSRGATGDGATAVVDKTAAAIAKTTGGSADPFAKTGTQPPGAVDTENIPPLSAAAIPTGPKRYGNIDPAMQDRLQGGVNAINQQIAAAEATLRAAPNSVNAQKLQQLRMERDKLAANPLLR